MKTKLLFFLFLVFSLFANAQQENCADNENQFSTAVANRDFKQAQDLWFNLYKQCPRYSQKMYQNESEVLQNTIEISNIDTKETAVRNLIKLYDTYDLNFPENKNGNYVNRAMALYKNKVGTDKEIYNYLDTAYKLQKETFSNPEALFVYFQIYFNQYKEGKSAISLDQLIEKTNTILALTSENKVNFPKSISEYKNVESNLNNMLQSVTTCKELSSYYQKNLEANATTVSWLETAAKNLATNCASDAVFEKIASALHTLKPSSTSAEYMANYYLKNKETSKAVDYFSQSVSLATNPLEKAKAAYSVALITSMSDKEKSKSMILTAIENEASNGQYYIFYANLIANSANECAKNEIEKKAIYKLAANTVLKAAVAEPRLKPTANKMADDFLKSANISANLKNKSVQIGCWINEKVEL